MLKSVEINHLPVASSISDLLTIPLSKHWGPLYSPCRGSSRKDRFILLSYFVHSHTGESLLPWSCVLSWPSLLLNTHACLNCLKLANTRSLKAATQKVRNNVSLQAEHISMKKRDSKVMTYISMKFTHKPDMFSNKSSSNGLATDLRHCRESHPDSISRLSHTQLESNSRYGFVTTHSSDTSRR